MNSLYRSELKWVQAGESHKFRTRDKFKVKGSRQLFRAFFHDPEEGNQFLIEIVQNLYLTRSFSKEHPRGSSKWLDVAGVIR